MFGLTLLSLGHRQAGSDTPVELAYVSAETPRASLHVFDCSQTVAAPDANAFSYFKPNPTVRTCLLCATSVCIGILFIGADLGIADEQQWWSRDSPVADILTASWTVEP